MGTKYAGSPEFNKTFEPYGAKQGGILGTGMTGPDLSNALLQTAAVAQGDYGGAAAIGNSAPRRLKAQQDAELQRQIRMYDYKRQNPDMGDDAFTRAMAQARIQEGSPEYVTMARKRAEMLTNPVQLVPDGMGGMTAVRPQAMSGLPAVGSIVPDPRKAGGAASTAPAPFPQGGGTDYDQFKSAIIGQESGGRYGVPNAQGSGAMGVGQVMPQTAQTLAQRLGLPWRPDLMAGQHPEARQYQDAITEAAAREAWQAGGNDPATAAMYYHGGSNRKIWGPKTHRYAEEVLSRMNRGG